MSGINLLLNTAKEALMAQQLAMDVIGHNVANVDTADYTRQVPILQAKDAAEYEGILVGTGVDVTGIQRNADAFIENRLQQSQSDLSASAEKELYMNVLESIFDESSESGLSSQMADFWNAWNDLANNPSGDAERSALYERGALLCQAFSDISADLDQLQRELNLSLDAGTEEINELTEKIAELNDQIVAMSATGDANDLIDQRQHLVNQLSEYLDISYYLNSDNTMTVTTGKGYALVSRADSYALSFDGNGIRWESSGTSTTDITDTITGGKMGGWLDMRDSIIPGYKDKLNQLSSSLIWEVNNIHAQGVGLASLTDVTGTYQASDATQNLWDQNSGLDFWNSIDSAGTFDIWVYDTSGNVVGGGPNTIDIDGAGVNTLNGIASTVDGIAGMNAEVTADGRLRIYSDSGYSFAFSDDTSGVLTASGINTFFTGSDASTMTMNAELKENGNLIAAARVDATGEIASGDNTNALDMAELQYRDATALGDTLGNYLASLESSIGLKSQSIIRTREYDEMMVNNLKETRDNISAVSIDEEMTQLIKYQHAYAAAAKLISAADEMYQTLLETK